MDYSRRGFLRTVVGSSTVASLAPTVPAFLQRTALADAGSGETSENVLVVLQLSGGNDGLNTIVPYSDDVYGRSRRTLRLGPKDVIRIDDFLGFHSQMPGFKRLLEKGQLSIVQGVGYPQNDRSHDVALRDWHTAQPGDSACQTGWIGRAADLVSHSPDTSVPAAFVGPIALPYALNSESTVVPAIRQLNQLAVGPSKAEAYAVSEPLPSGGSLLEDVRKLNMKAMEFDRRISDVLRDDQKTRVYPRFTLAGHLRQVSQLIRANLGIRIFFVELGGGGIGGFDNHANQRDNHAALLREMSESITAFAEDLAQQGSLPRVMLMTFSEFGRTVSENGRRGTGHGSAAPVFLVGGSLKPGLHGRHPSLTDLVQDAPKFHTDFRRLYATVLQDWLGYDARTVLGSKYSSLELLA